MKKHFFLFLAMLLLGSAGLLSAQNEILHFFDDFESGTLTHWTTIDADGDGHCWSVRLDSDHDNCYAVSDPFKYDPSNYLVSPLLEDVTKITFDACVFPEEGFEDFKVYASTTGNQYGDFTEVLLDTYAVGNSWGDFTVALPTGTKYVAIVHKGSINHNDLLIDNVKIWGNESNCIYSIDVDGFTRPHWGAHPDFDVTVSSDAHCSINDVVWYWESISDAGEMTANSTFNHEDYVYYMGIYFTPQSGYHFSDYTRVYYNGNPHPFDVVYSSVLNSGEFRAWTISYQLYDPMGVDEQPSEQLVARPNPTTDKLYLEGMDGKMVNVYDNMGRLVLQERYNGYLNVNTLSQGVYTISVEGCALKFIKE